MSSFYEIPFPDQPREHFAKIDNEPIYTEVLKKGMQYQEFRKHVEQSLMQKSFKKQFKV